MDNWMDDFSHESLSTPEEQQSFRTAMGDYATKDDAVVGGFNAKKATGKPFKLPESLDKLPDDTVRADFTTQVRKVLGIEAGITEENLGKINWTKGMPAGSEATQPLVEAFSKFVIENNLSESFVQKVVEFSNIYNTAALQEIKQKADETTNQNIDKSSAMLKEYFGEAGLKEHAELMRQVFADPDLSKLTAEEYESIAGDLTDEVLKGKSIFTKALLNICAPFAKEGRTEASEGGGPKVGTKTDTLKKELPETSKALGWVDK